ncbi:cytochrome P450 9e2-like [Diachasma alloeum]|uniref:cytochrome P450 9e2-like n=1 Tax=Diachasma alloeum TaxID=454923 RepID=UPI0007382A9F|nr:cytochrome P450 9e2-like [Diachasma alloeum]
MTREITIQWSSQLLCPVPTGPTRAIFSYCVKVIMELCTFLLTTVIVYLLYHFFLKKENFFEKNGIPHVKPLTAVAGSVCNLVRGVSLAESVSEFYNANSKVKYAGTSFLMTSALMICDLELTKQITVKYFDHFVNHDGFVDPTDEPIFGNNLFFLHDNKWREVRNLLTPAFTSSKLKGMFKLMSECAAAFADYLAERSHQKPLEIDSKDVFTRYANDLIGTCAFGVKVDSMRNPNNEFYILGRKATNFGGLNVLKLIFVQKVPRLAKLLGIRIVSDDVEKFFIQLVRDTIAMRDEKGITRPDVIQLMMETRNNEGHGRVLTIPEMTAQAFVFFFGGFESTSTFMCFAMQMMAENPEIQVRLQSEVDEVFDEEGDNPPYEAVNNMVYLDAVVNETLRMYPVNAVMDRVCTKEFELPPPLSGKKPVLLKPGFVVWIPYYALLRDPSQYPDPDVFNPERFISDGKTSAHAAASLAFGLGPRMCIGNRFAILETKVLLVHILRKCSVKPADRMITPVKLDPYTFAMKAKGGFWLEVQPRQK